MKVLVVEDCLDTQVLIERSLAPCQIQFTENIRDTKNLLVTYRPDIILIDVDLPDGNGVEFCTELSQDPIFIDVPKIILTASKSPETKIFGLYSGADDFVTKPFMPQELKARCELRVVKKKKNNNKVIDPFVFNFDFQKVSIISGQIEKFEINLTPTQFRVLYVLVSNQGQAFTRQELVRQIWKQVGTNIEERGIDSHISHIRKKLKDLSISIVSVYGRGYSYNSNLIPLSNSIKAQ